MTEMTLAILRFSGPFDFLSNFFVEPDGTHVEGDFQMRKCRYTDDRKLFYKQNGRLRSPAQCKAIGHTVVLVPEWDARKDAEMLLVLRKKFRDHPELAQRLLDTGNAELIEGNTWGDEYWGVYRGKGENMLGKLLMMVRTELRS